MSILTSCYEQLSDWLKLESRLGVAPEFQDGLFAGVAAMLIGVLIVWLILHRIRRRKSCRTVTVKGKNGDLVITVGAIREFVTRILHEFGDASLQSVRLRQARNSLHMNVEIAVVPETDLVPLRDMLQTRIVKDASTRLGLTMPLRVNIRVRSLEADQNKIARKAKKSGKLPESTGAGDTDVFEDYESAADDLNLG